jgi:elongation factor 1-gamma
VRLPWDQWKSAEYFKKHPLGKVPTLETPEGSIYESAAILRYLARTAGKFYGNSPAETATIDQWLEFVNSQFNPNNVRTVYGTLGYMPVTKDQYEAGKKDFLDVLKIVDAQLKKTKFLAGNEISVADIALIGGVRLLLRLIFDEKARATIPHVVQWYQRLFELAQISEFFGSPWLCTKELLPEFATEKKEEPKKEEAKKESKPAKGKKKEEKGEKKAEPKKKKDKKKGEPKKDKKKKDSDE